MTAITVGCDPEVFLKKDNTIVGSLGLLGGNKTTPRPVNDGAILEDNVLAEININPARNKSEFVSRIVSVLDQLRVLADSDIDFRSSHEFDEDYLWDNEYRGAMDFGCDPDFNAYTGEQNEKPNAFLNLRTAGGHIHVGYEGSNHEQLIKTMDLLLGVPSVLLDDDVRRRSMYGQAGAYRPKPYGVEYRVLSNFWLKSDELMQWAYDQTVLAVQVHNSIRLPEENTIINCINNSDKELAKDIICENDIIIPRS